jgi:hypothetical protein
MLAPLTAIDSGSPRPSTNNLRLRPFTPAVGWVPACALGCQRRFAHGSVRGLPLPYNVVHTVVLGQTGLPELLEETGSMPDLEVLMHRTGRTV